MVEVLAAQKDIICQYLLCKWNILKEFHQVLNIPYIGTIKLQKIDLTLSDVFGVWLEMQLLIERLLKKKMTTNLAILLKNSIQNRKKLVFDNSAMICAVYLDPRFRAEITQHQSLANENDAKTNLLNLWNRLKLNQHSNTINDKSETENVSSSSILNSSDSFDLTREMCDYLKRDSHNVSSLSNLSAETNDLNSELESFKPDFMPFDQSILNYWEARKDLNPLLYELAMAIYSIPPTEVQIERDFSALEKILTKYRTQLSPRILEAILLINLNKDLFYDVRDDKINELKLKLNQ